MLPVRRLEPLPSIPQRRQLSDPSIPDSHFIVALKVSDPLMPNPQCVFAHRQAHYAKPTSGVSDHGIWMVEDKSICALPRVDITRDEHWQ